VPDREMLESWGFKGRDIQDAMEAVENKGCSTRRMRGGHGHGRSEGHSSRSHGHGNSSRSHGHSSSRSHHESSRHHGSSQGHSSSQSHHGSSRHNGSSSHGHGSSSRHHGSGYEDESDDGIPPGMVRRDLDDEGHCYTMSCSDSE
jgi:hypothetical protein